MSETILDKIFAAKKVRVEAAKRSIGLERMMELAAVKRASGENHRLRLALQVPDRLNIIAEFKRASPSKGIINDSVDAATLARSYKSGGAAAISVLTEEDFFKGSLDDLRAVRNAVDLPILRKEFIFDAYQIYEAAEAGADAILLIAAMLEDEALVELHNLAEQVLGLDALVEVHTLEELELVKNVGAKLIGVNNRDLRTFNVSLNVSRELIKHAPKDAVMIAESGLTTRDDLMELQELGYSGFLIGETLMRSGDPETQLRVFAMENSEKRF
ncbi:MAG: indole-3-glycerol phosphate synthase TrpC [Pyrinomonadaceae bacterium]